MDPAYKCQKCANQLKYSTSLKGITIFLSRIDVEKPTYLLAVPVNVEEFLQILIERKTTFRLKLHLEAAISCMTSNLCSFRSSAVAIALCVVTFRFQKQLFLSVELQLVGHGLFRQAWEVVRLKKEGT